MRRITLGLLLLWLNGCRIQPSFAQPPTPAPPPRPPQFFDAPIPIAPPPDLAELARRQFEHKLQEFVESWNGLMHDYVKGTWPVKKVRKTDELMERLRRDPAWLER